MLDNIEKGSQSYALTLRSFSDFDPANTHTLLSYQSNFMHVNPFLTRAICNHSYHFLWIPLLWEAHSPWIIPISSIIVFFFTFPVVMKFFQNLLYLIIFLLSYCSISIAYFSNLKMSKYKSNIHILWFLLFI